MYGDRLLKTATILIVIGMAGLFGMAWVGGSSMVSDNMMAMMTGDGMREMMKRHRMNIQIPGQEEEKKLLAYLQDNALITRTISSPKETPKVFLLISYMKASPDYLRIIRAG